jgi:hypothetical protein
MKIRNLVLVGLAVAVLAAGGGLWWLYASRDALVKRAIEHLGPEITGVSVSVNRVRLEPVDGKGSIAGLAVGNPAGYKAPRSVTLGEIRMALDVGTLTSNVVHLKELVIDAPELTYERGPGGDNFSAIQKHVDQQAGKAGGGGDKKEKTESSSGRKFVIDNLIVRNAKVKFSDTLTLSMPDLHLRDVGKKSNGATAGEVVKTVWDQLAGSAGNLASRAGDLLKEGAKGAVDSASGAVKGAQGAVDSVRGLLK